MVYIEERVSKLEETVQVLQRQLADALADVQALNDKKRKADVVDRAQLNQAVADLQLSFNTKLEEVGAAKGGGATGGVSEERLAQVFQEVQAIMNQRLETYATTETLAKTVAVAQEQQGAVAQQNLNTAIQNVQTGVQQKVQVAVQACQGLQQIITQNQAQMQAIQPMSEQMNRIQQMTAEIQMGHQWKDVDLNDQAAFDVNKVYRLRIGEGQQSRWLYSAEVSLGQIYTGDNILDQAIVINAATKSSYGARRTGSDISTTAYFAVFQLQTKSF